MGEGWIKKMITDEFKAMAAEAGAIKDAADFKRMVRTIQSMHPESLLDCFHQVTRLNRCKIGVDTTFRYSPKVYDFGPESPITRALRITERPSNPLLGTNDH